MEEEPKSRDPSEQNEEDKQDEEAKAKHQAEGTSNDSVQNLNSYYGHKIGFLQSLSLILNAGLMVYAHVGLSAVILSSQDPATTSISPGNSNSSNSTDLCNAQDNQLYTEYAGEETRPTQSSFCSREYKFQDDNNICLLRDACIEECFQTTYNYSAICTTCYSALPACSWNEGCGIICGIDSLGEECATCNIPCVEKFLECTGFSDSSAQNATFLPTQAPTTANASSVRRQLQTRNSTAAACNEYDLDLIDQWYTVYNLTFVSSVQDAWNGDAQLLAFIVVIFSGIWPYLKNIILLVVWYLPMSVEKQKSTILWLSRLSKYTLVDVFAIIVVLIGVQLQLNIGGTEAVIRAEPRFGIIAFFLATLWEFLQIEVIKAMYERKIDSERSDDPSKESAPGMNAATEENSKEQLLFSSLWIPALLLIISIALYVAGAVTELVHFTSKNIDGNDEGCVKSYNLVTLANALINELGLTDNSVAWQMWILYIVYIILILALPVLVHVLQIAFLAGWARNPGDMSSAQKRMSSWTIAFWCFACVEVMLIGVFAVEYKFANLIKKISGESNAMFLDISSGLGPGFYLLIAYSVLAGFFQFSIRIRPASTIQSNEDPQEAREENSNGV